MYDFAADSADCARSVEAGLSERLTVAGLSGPGPSAERLVAAMRHGSLEGGKRLRPLLVRQAAAIFSIPKQAALPAGLAVEMVHCYSLIHDDLPAMDDDDLRRGRPTVHRAFDEASAILAGDSLLTFAFDIIADEATNLPANVRVRLVAKLARAAGMGGMAGGQALDLAAAHDKPDEAGIVRLQAMKTGALIRFACEAGAEIGQATQAERERLAEFGQAIGLAFQLADDLLDATADASVLGKAAGKDEEAGKATLVSLHGLDWTRKQLDGLVAQAGELLQPFGAKADLLREAARFIAIRQS